MNQLSSSCSDIYIDLSLPEGLQRCLTAVWVSWRAIQHNWAASNTILSPACIVVQVTWLVNWVTHYLIYIYLVIRGYLSFIYSILTFTSSLSITNRQFSAWRLQDTS